MQPFQTENIRLSLLRHCDASGRYGLTEGLLLQFLRSEGMRALGLAQLQSELDYLAGKGLLARMEKLISPEIPAWRITAGGRDFLAQNFPSNS